MEEIFYKYYKLCPSQEHYLFAKELCERIGLYSRKYKPHTKFFSDLYDSLVPEDEEKLYYHTHNGMVRVLSNWDTIFKIIDIVSNEIKKNIDNTNSTDTAKNLVEFTYPIEEIEYIVRADVSKVKTIAYLLKRSKGEDNA